MLFIWNGSVLPKILPRLLFLLGLSVFIYHFHNTFFSHVIRLNPAAFTLVGVALAIFLAFCNTAAYDRFWEGRKLWGALVIDTRSVVRQVQAYAGQGATREEDSVAHFTRLVVAFTYALKHQLRHTPADEDLDRLLPPVLAAQLKPVVFKPVLLLAELAAWLQRAEQQGRIDTIVKMGIDQNLDKLSDIVGGCERIANTPIPFPYHVLLHRTVYIYCFLLPFGLVDSLGWMTPLIVTFIGYTFIALDAIVDEISEPFGTEPNDLALNSICATVEFSLNEMTGLPLPPQPVRSGKVID